MKLFRSLVAVVLLLCIFVLPVSAAEFTPSAEEKDGPGLVGVPGEGKGVVGIIHNGNGHGVDKVLEDEVLITPIKDADKEGLPEEIKSALEESNKELEEKDLDELVPGFEQLWNNLTEGAPLDNAVISNIFDIRVIGDKEALLDGEHSLTISFKLQGITAEDYFLLIGKNLEDGTWSNVEYTISEDGVITVTITKETPFAVVVDNGNAPDVDPDAPDSPQTGVFDYTFYAVVAMLLFAFVSLVSFVKAKKQA